MKNVLKNAMKAGSVALAVAGFVTVGVVESAHASSLRFTPAGSNLPDDPLIKDQVIPDSTSTISFDLFFKNTESFAITEISYFLGWDSKELKLNAFNPLDDTFISPVTIPPALVALASASGIGPVISDFKARKIDQLFTVAAGSEVKIGDISFNILRPGLINDGKIDFASLFTDNGSGLSFQYVEVQPKDIIPTPALLPGFAAMGLGMLRKKRQAKTAVA
jgi:hypothetical protein